MVVSTPYWILRRVYLLLRVRNKDNKVKTSTKEIMAPVDVFTSFNQVKQNQKSFDGKLKLIG